MSGTTGWEQLGDPAPADLVEARLQLHYAGQVLGAVGNALVTPTDDWAQLSCTWDDDLRALVTGEITGTRCRVGLHLATMTLALVDDGTVVSEQALPGMTLQDALARCGDAIAAHTGRPLPKPLALLEHELPAHPIADGARFSGEGSAAWAEIARWFANADRVLGPVRAAAGSGAAPVRTWPHHFDMATLITTEAHDDPEQAKSINVGMSPGDGGYAEPYLYVVPWPAPDAPPTQPLHGGGTWHTEGWTGAVLTGSALVAQPDQAAAIDAFLRTAIAAARQIVGADG